MHRAPVPDNVTAAGLRRAASPSRAPSKAEAEEAEAEAADKPLAALADGEAVAEQTKHSGAAHFRSDHTHKASDRGLLPRADRIPGAGSAPARGAGRKLAADRADAVAAKDEADAEAAEADTAAEEAKED